MNLTASAYTGARAVTFVANGNGASTVVRSGSQATLEAVVVHFGMRGEKGDNGDLTYTHPQGAASDVWVITHGLGKKPSVTVQDSAYDTVDGDVFYNDSNTLTITFSAAFSGFAYLN